MHMYARVSHQVSLDQKHMHTHSRFKKTPKEISDAHSAAAAAASENEAKRVLQALNTRPYNRIIIASH